MKARGTIVLHSRRQFPSSIPISWEIRARRDVGPLLYFKFLSNTPTVPEQIDDSTYRCYAMVEADEEGLEYNLGIGIRWEIPSDMSEAGIYVVNNTTEMVGGADPEANPIPGFGRSLDYAGVGRRMLRPSTWQTYDENNVRQSHRTMKLSPVETWNA